MSPDRVSAGFFAVGRKEASGVLHFEMLARRFDAEHSDGRDDRDDHECNDHLHDRESALPPGFSAVAVHWHLRSSSAAGQTPAWSNCWARAVPVLSVRKLEGFDYLRLEGCYFQCH